MPSHRIAARQPRGEATTPVVITDADRLLSVAEDAAHVAGRASALVVPVNEAEVAAVLRGCASVLPIGAQSSLTGGAAPQDDVVLSTARLNRIIRIGDGHATVEAGVTLAELDRALALGGHYYPPAPTFTAASVGGTIATNAAGAATFKYGTTRDWVEGVTVVLANGEVLEVARGTVRAHADGYFEVIGSSAAIRIPVPRYRMPDVAKASAGYFAAPHMDLIDLFIGAEGTLGVVVSATLRIITPPPARCLAFVPVAETGGAFALVRTLRDAARETWRTGNALGLDISAIEHLDARCLELAREDGLDRKAGITWPRDTAIALLVTLDLHTGATTQEAYDQIGRSLESGTADTSIGRFCRALDAAGAIDDVLIAAPGDAARIAQLLGFREELPASVNARVARAKRLDPRIEKTAGDMIVPFERLPELFAAYDDEFTRRRLDVATWGHISDGNLHPNVLPRSFTDVESGRAAMLEAGRAAIRLGGSPLAEHGVGRNRVKQQLLEELYGRAGVEEMRAVKRALDPEWKLAPGVLFPASRR